MKLKFIQHRKKQVGRTLLAFGRRLITRKEMKELIAREYVLYCCRPG